MKKLALTCCAVAAMLGVPAVMAQTYVSAGIGPAKISADCSGADTCDTNSTGGKVLVGMTFAPNWAGELSYFDFGKAKATGVVDVPTGAREAPLSSGPLSARLKATAWGAGVAYRAQFAPAWSGVARLGIARTKAELSGTLLDISGSDSQSSTNAYGGIAVGYAFSKAVSLDAGLDFSRVKYEGERDNVRLFSVGLSVFF